MKLNLTHVEQATAQTMGGISGPVNPITLAGPRMSGGNGSTMTADDDSVEATVNGSFEILGQRQEVLAGASYSKVDGGGRVDYSSLISSTYVPYPGAAAGYPAVNVFNFNPYDLRYAQPGRGPPSDILTLLDQTISGAYVNVKLTAFDKLHLITGVRYSHFAFNSGALSLCTTLTGSCRTKQIGDSVAAPSHLATSAEDFSWPPTVVRGVRREEGDFRVCHVYRHLCRPVGASRS